MKRHYVYRLEDRTTGEFYWGVRSCNCNPEDDKYMGSMSTWKPNKNNLDKVIYREFNSREEANESEMCIIEMFIDKKIYPLNRNYHNPKIGFCTLGLKLSDEVKSKMIGRKKSLSHRANLSKSLKGKVSPNKGKSMSEEQKAKLRVANTGKKQTEQHKLNSKSGRSGYTHSEETKNKIGKANKGKANISAKGKPLTEEHKDKIRLAKRSISNETRAKLSKANKGKPNLTLKGLPKSEEHKEKLRLAWIKRKQAKLDLENSN